MECRTCVSWVEQSFSHKPGPILPLPINGIPKLVVQPGIGNLNQGIPGWSSGSLAVDVKTPTVTDDAPTGRVYVVCLDLVLKFR